MRIEEGGGVVLHQRLILVVVLHLAACGGGFSDPLALDPDAAGDDDVDAGVRTDQDAAVSVDSDSDGIVDAIDNCPQVANSGQLDGDVDGYGDDCDCDAADAAIAAELVLSDSLDADRALIAPATGFPTASWLHQTQSYRQLRLDDDAADAAAFAFGALTNVRVDVTTASTNTESFGGDDLRQLFVFARGASSNAAVSALACGVEIDESLNDIRQTSIIELSGSPLAPASTVKAQTARDRLDEDEEFSITLDLKGQTMTCTVVIDGVTTVATTTQALGATGTVGFYTRETEAAFKNVRVCSYRDE